MTIAVPRDTENSVLLCSAKPSFANRSIFFGQSPEMVYTGESREFSWDRLRDLANRFILAGYLSYDLAEHQLGLPPRRDVLPAFWLACFKEIRVGDAITGAWRVWDTRGNKKTCSAPEIVTPERVNLNFQGLDQSRDAYCDTIERIRSDIEHGHYYQLNYTMKAEFRFAGTAGDLFGQIIADQAVPYAALIRTGAGAVISGSPELFFRLRRGRVCTKPMKGTTAPGPGARRRLKNSSKDRAENLMIVDLMRHDLGRVCERVWVEDLYRVERYATVYQMVSRVLGEMRPDQDGVDLLAASFPPGSVTGTPKSSATEAINRLEVSSRGVYTGIVGIMFPWDDSTFSVAIRTCELVGDRLWYGVGSGITYASEASAEYDECLTKMAPLRNLCEVAQ